MARKKQGDPISDILGSHTQRTHSEHVENTQGTRSEHWEGRAKTELQTFSVRLSPADVETLREYFTARGLGISQGIRMWVAERMEQEGLR